MLLICTLLCLGMKCMNEQILICWGCIRKYFYWWQTWSKKCRDHYPRAYKLKCCCDIQCFSWSGLHHSLWPTSGSPPSQPVLGIPPAWTRSWQLLEFLTPPPTSYSHLAFGTHSGAAFLFLITYLFPHKASPGILCTYPTFSANFSMTLFCNHLFTCLSTTKEGSALTCLYLDAQLSCRPSHVVGFPLNEWGMKRKQLLPQELLYDLLFV